MIASIQISGGRLGKLLNTLALTLLFSVAWTSDTRADYVTGLDPYGDNYLSLRSGPGSRYREIMRMGPDTIVTVLERRGDWRKIRLEDGAVGWAFGRYIRSGFPAGAEPSVQPEEELRTATSYVPVGDTQVIEIGNIYAVRNGPTKPVNIKTPASRSRV